MNNFTKLFVTIFYIGYIKKAPGTWCSLASVFLMYFLINVLSLSSLLLMPIFTILFFLANYFINKFSAITNTNDSKQIVIDELLGVFFIFLFYDYMVIYNNFLTCILIFIIFRLFDISKIFPANFFDKKLHNGYGVILDDIVAGIYTILTMMILNVFL